MRSLLSYIMAGVLLIGAVAAWSYNRAEHRAFEAQIEQARATLQRLERAIRIQGATGKTPINGRGWPETVDPAWFGDDPPLNAFIPPGRPWVEVASEEEDTLTDPPIRQSVTRDLAMYWYNPATGVVRARVGPMISDRRAVDVYNRINGTSVSTLFDARALLRDAPMLSPAQERLLAGAVNSRKPPLIVVHRRPAPPDAGADGGENGDIRTSGNDSSDIERDPARRAHSDAPAETRRADHTDDQFDER